MHDLRTPLAEIFDPLSRSAALLPIDTGLAGNGRRQDGVR
jgi:hypothetical protein